MGSHPAPSLAGTSVPVSLSAVDEDRFGVRTARAYGLTAATLPDTLTYCHENSVRLLIARSQSTEAATLRAAHRAGLQLMDILMYWRGDLRQMTMPAAVGHIRPARPDEAENLREVALRSFKGYLGHYHADPRLDDVLCDQVYGEWAYRSCADDSTGIVLVAEVDGRSVGFASALIKGGEARALLSGVDPSFRRRGLFPALNGARIRWCKAQGAAVLWSPTLAANVATQRSYAKAGLVHSHACYTFHKWFDEPNVTL